MSATTIFPGGSSPISSRRGSRPAALDEGGSRPSRRRAARSRGRIAHGSILDSAETAPIDLPRGLLPGLGSSGA